MIRSNEPITFRGLARTAGVSLDFLYRCAPIRQRVKAPCQRLTLVRNWGVD